MFCVNGHRTWNDFHLPSHWDLDWTARVIAQPICRIHPILLKVVPLSLARPCFSVIKVFETYSTSPIMSQLQALGKDGADMWRRCESSCVSAVVFVKDMEMT